MAAADLLESARTRIVVALRRPDWGPKVFCIGFNKTGTTSVGIALASFGFRHASFNRHVWRSLYEQGNIEAVINYAARFESFDDLPWLKEDLIPVLDQRFPKSKFVYLEREEHAWKTSYLRWNAQAKNRDVDPEIGWAEYVAHREFVLGYFQDFPTTNFLRLRLTEPDSINRLADFVGRVSPTTTMPHVNRSS